jgi:hypothetical protein
VLADWDLWLRLYAPGRLFITREVLVGYRFHDSNMHVAELNGVRRELRHLRRKHRHRAEATGTFLGATEFSLWLVGRYRESGHYLQAAREYTRLAWLQRRPRQLARATAMLARLAAKPITTPDTETASAYPWLRPPTQTD